VSALAVAVGDDVSTGSPICTIDEG